jgi:hypothetical protein
MKKNEKTNTKRPKNRTFAPHAAKAQTKKLWYLKDQLTVATTGMADQTDPQKVAITNDLLPPVQSLQKARINPVMTVLKKDTQAAQLPNAVLFRPVALKRKASDHANHTLAAQPVVTRKNQKDLTEARPLATKKALHRVVSHIQAAHQKVVIANAQEKALVAIRRISLLVASLMAHVMVVMTIALRKALVVTRRISLLVASLMAHAMVVVTIALRKVLVATGLSTVNQKVQILAISLKEPLQVTAILINQRATASLQVQNR